MSQSSTNDHPSRIMTLDEYRKAHESDRASLSSAPRGGTAVRLSR